MSVMGLGLSLLLIVAALDRATLPRAFAATVALLPIGGLLTHAPKYLLGMPRPAAVLPPEALHIIGQPIMQASSMPSGHALAAFGVAMVLHHAGLRSGWRLLGWLLALGVALSRVVTAAHWPGDIVTGAALGVISGGLALRLTQGDGLARWLARPRTQRGLALAEVAGALALALQHTGYPTAVPMQALLAVMALASAARRWQLSRSSATSATSGSAPEEPLESDAASLAPSPPGQNESVWSARLVLSCLGAGALLSALWSGVDSAILRSAWQALPAWALPVAVLGWWLSYLLRAERLHREWSRWAQAQASNRPVPGRLDCLSLFLHHNATLALLPMRAGEAGYPWWLWQRWGVPLRESLRSLLWLRVQDVLALLLCSLVLVLPLVWALACALALAGALSLVVRHPRVAAWLSGAAWGDAPGWALCLGNWCLKLAVIGGLLAALTGLDPAGGWRAALGGEWAAALPLQAPASLGSYEAGVWALAHELPLSARLDALALVPAALAVHLLGLAVALLSWALWRAAARWHSSPPASSPKPLPPIS